MSHYLTFRLLLIVAKLSNVESLISDVEIAFRCLYQVLNGRYWSPLHNDLGCGYGQIAGRNFLEVFGPVAHYVTFRFLLILSMLNKM